MKYPTQTRGRLSFSTSIFCVFKAKCNSQLEMVAATLVVTIIWWVPFLAVLCDWCKEMNPSPWCDIMCVLSFFFFWLHYTAYKLSGPLTGIESGPRPWRPWVSTTGPPGNSLVCPFFFHLRTHWIFTLVTCDQSGVGITLALGSLLFKLCVSVKYEEKYKWVCRLIL